jgi:hypothetical protein
MGFAGSEGEGVSVAEGVKVIVEGLVAVSVKVIVREGLEYGYQQGPASGK